MAAKAKNEKYDLTRWLAQIMRLMSVSTGGGKNQCMAAYMGIQRATFLIGPDGTILHVWPKVKVPGHADDVLGHIRSGG